MNPKLQPVRGTHDILPEESNQQRFVVDMARRVAGNYGYGEITTPIFEFTEVFQRTLGDTSDVVTKETYSFTDRGGENITLRPEFTASVARAFISGGMKDQLPLRFFYQGPAFRYERPQKGRMRQFHQIGVELLGVAEPIADIEVIALATHIFAALGIEDKVKLELNSLGDGESRTAYRNALVEYYHAHKSQLSEDSVKRLERNPLRILDSKDEGDKKINANAPAIGEYFTPTALAFFNEVQEGLRALNIPFSLNPRLVRGLDYYSHTVFEFTADPGSAGGFAAASMLGAQNTLLAGGRYDGLVGMMGGPETPGIGWAAGIERFCLAVDFASHPAMPKTRRPVVVVPISDTAAEECLKLAHTLRGKGFYVELSLRGNLSKRMKRADKLNAVAVLMLGDEELAKGTATLKLLATGEQQEVAFHQIEKTLEPFL